MNISETVRPNLLRIFCLIIRAEIGLIYIKETNEISLYLTISIFIMLLAT